MYQQKEKIRKRKTEKLRTIGFKAVSYTHLDVYKRQGERSFYYLGRKCMGRKPAFSSSLGW